MLDQFVETGKYPKRIKRLTLDHPHDPFVFRSLYPSSCTRTIRFIWLCLRPDNLCVCLYHIKFFHAYFKQERNSNTNYNHRPNSIQNIITISPNTTKTHPSRPICGLGNIHEPLEQSYSCRSEFFVGSSIMHKWLLINLIYTKELNLISTRG